MKDKKYQYVGYPEEPDWNPVILNPDGTPVIPPGSTAFSIEETLSEEMQAMFEWVEEKKRANDER